MLQEKITEQSQNKVIEPEIDSVPNAGDISIKTVVNILVKKGVCTTDEIFKLESKLGDGKPYKTDVSFVNIKNPYDRGKFPGVKRWMSKHRWSRKLGTWIFGWKWKRVKKVPKQEIE